MGSERTKWEDEGEGMEDWGRWRVVGWESVSEGELLVKAPTSRPSGENNHAERVEGGEEGGGEEGRKEATSALLRSEAAEG